MRRREGKRRREGICQPQAQKQFQNTARDQFENSRRVGHGEKGEGNEFEFRSSSRSLEFGFSSKFNFFKSGGGSSSLRVRLQFELHILLGVRVQFELHLLLGGVEVSASSGSVRIPRIACCGEGEIWNSAEFQGRSNSNLIRCQFRN